MGEYELASLDSEPLYRPPSIASKASSQKPLTATPEKKRYFGGWRTGLAISTSAAAFVTLANIIFLGVVGARVNANGGALWTGDCKTAKEYSLWLHLAINALATVLLGAGNYTQQVLTGPTRQEIDQAHDKRQWLDIGVSSIHNLTKISIKRVAAWTVLALSSLPIHLLYATVSHKSVWVANELIDTTRWSLSKPAPTTSRSTLLHPTTSRSKLSAT